MFPARYFCNRHFAPRYFPKEGSGAAPIVPNFIRFSADAYAAPSVSTQAYAGDSEDS